MGTVREKPGEPEKPVLYSAGLKAARDGASNRAFTSVAYGQVDKGGVGQSSVRGPA